LKRWTVSKTRGAQALRGQEQWGSESEIHMQFSRGLGFNS
jgi:hypothetical protein